MLHNRDCEPLPPLQNPGSVTFLEDRGGGLVQVRLRVCDPPPHVKLQLPQAFQFDHPPSLYYRKNPNVIKQAFTYSDCVSYYLEVNDTLNIQLNKDQVSAGSMSYIFSHLKMILNAPNRLESSKRLVGRYDLCCNAT